MGRGRAKAKQQKVARELKYSTQDTDFSALQKELGRPGDAGYRPPSDADPDNADDEGDDEEPWVSNYR
jgi:Protein of unknown function (DUF3073)